MQNISSIGKPNELKQLCPNIRELDISKNLISKWTDIFDICSQLDRLHWLNVSQNCLELPDKMDCAFPGLKTLICGHCRLTWTDVLRLLKVFQNLEELRLPYNNIQTIQIPNVSIFNNVSMIDLENNPIKDWSEIAHLGVLPELKHLFIDKVGIQRIELEGKRKSHLFWKLHKLVVNDNQIDNVSSLN